jgi:hypothetical protein
MKAHRIIPVVLLLLFSASLVAAATTSGPKRRARPARTNPEDAGQRIDINNISMVVKNTGSFAYDTQTGGAGLEFPKGTGKTAVFAAGFWMGALVNGGIRVSVAEYSDDFEPGAIVGGASEPDSPALKVYKLNRVYLTADGAVDAATRDAALADYNAGAVPRGAPVVTVQGDGSLNIIGDQMMWSVYNDLKPGRNTAHNSASSALPLGIEIQQTTFAFSRQGPLGNTVFMKYRIENKSSNTLTDAYVSQWSDPDLGGFTDDLVGCDTVLSVGFVYNATNNDEQYGVAAPCVGYDFLQGPSVGGTPLGLASFNKYPNGGGPQDSVETYNYMKGLNGDGTDLINEVTGLPTRFNVSGDPVANTGWLDASPSDRRLMLSSGPFTMAPGAVQEVVVGIVVAQGQTRLSSVALMKCFDQAVQAAYDAGFNLASPPNNPAVAITPRDGEVFIRWDTGSENYNQPPYVWEGYNVYQGASIAGPWTRVATYDRDTGGITTVLDVECDPDSPVPLQKVKAFGTDAGVRYSIELNSDRVRGGPLNSATAYFYAVTAYAVGIGEFQQVLESPIIPIRVVPQTPPAGTDLSAAGILTIDHGLAAGAPGGTPLGTDVVTVDVLDPATVVSADYKLGFKPAGTGTVWWLTRTVGAVTDTIINNWPNVSGDANYPVVDGFQVKVVSFPLGELARITYEGGPPAYEGDPIGLRFFNGGGDYAADLFGSSLPSHGFYGNVEMRLTGGPDGQNAYRYLRTLEAGVRVYRLQDYVPVPFTVWNVDADPDQQLNVAFLENDGAATENGAWAPGSTGDGGREIVWPLASSYSGNTPDPAYFDPGNSDFLAGNVDATYVIWPLSTGTAPAAGDKIVFTTSIPSSRWDEYTFSTTAPNAFNASLAKSELDRIRAVPNPYFAHSTYETNRFNRVLKFTHLPARCTIRLFNLAGDLVRTIEKNDNSSLVEWDLNTDHGLPIGSGVYIFHVDAPGVGSKHGKVAVFMEKERLNNF